MTELLAEYNVLMGLRTRPRARWIPATLAVMGSLALVAGVLVAVITMIRIPANNGGINLPLHSAIYVGDATCFTCHSDQSRDWSLMPYEQAIIHPFTSPRAIVVDVTESAEVREVAIHGSANAYTTDDAVRASSDRASQRYVIKTEDGHVFLPGQWNTADLSWGTASPLDWYTRCGGCHTTGFTVGDWRFSAFVIGALPTPLSQVQRDRGSAGRRQAIVRRI